MNPGTQPAPSTSSATSSSAATSPTEPSVSTSTMDAPGPSGVADTLSKNTTETTVPSQQSPSAPPASTKGEPRITEGSGVNGADVKSEELQTSSAVSTDETQDS